MWRKRMDQPEAAVVTGDGEAEECASSIVVSPNLLTPMQSQPSCCGHSGAEAATTSASASSLSSSSPFFSTRIQTLSERQSGFDSELEFQVESSKAHWTRDWTELSVATSNSDGGEDEQLPNNVVFENLKEHAVWGWFFRGEPTLPNETYLEFKNLVRKCWHGDPGQRPSFDEIVEDLRATANYVESVHRSTCNIGYSPFWGLNRAVGGAILGEVTKRIMVPVGFTTFLCTFYKT